MTEYPNAYSECIKQCPKDAKDCASAAFDAAGAARAVDEAYADACAKKRESCSDTFKNDTCEEAPLYVESAVKSAMACLELPCEQVAACVDTALE